MKAQALFLVAEDDPDDQYFFQEALAAISTHNVETYFVLDGAQLMKLLRAKVKAMQQPDLVVLDLNMRVQDGRATLREIRSDPALAAIPVAVLTTSTNADDLEYCKHYGATYYQKPDSIVELVKIVRILYRNHLNNTSPYAL